MEVAHHVPGRMRVRFSPAILTAPGAASLAAWAQGQKRNNGGYPKGLVNLRLNLGSRSLVIEYDRSIVDPQVLEELFSTQDKERMSLLVSELAESLGLDN